MSAFGQPPAGGAPAPAAGAPAPAAGGTPPAANNDPFGLQASLASAPDHLRPMLQSHYDQLGGQLQQRFQQYAPLDPYMEQLGPLLQTDDQGASQFGGLMELYRLFEQAGTNPEAADNLAEWWDHIGEEFGFFEDDGQPPANGTPPAGATPAAAAATSQVPDLSAVDPAIKTLIEGLQGQVAELTNSFQSTQRETQATQQAQAIERELLGLMKTNGIKGHDQINSAEATDILGMALRYGDDPQALQKATADYMRLTGAQTPPADDTSSLGGVAALQHALGGGAAPPQAQRGAHDIPAGALGPGNSTNEPEPVRGWADARRLALQRIGEQQK